MPVRISGDGTFAGLTSVETINVLHPDAVDPNIVLADDGSVGLEVVPSVVQSAIDAVPVLAGIGTNVVQSTVVTTASTTSTSYQDISGMSVSITPSSTDSKILLICSFVGSANNTAGDTGAFRVVRETTALAVNAQDWNYEVGRNLLVTGVVVHLDSPNTTSATTYKLQFRTVSGTGVQFNQDPFGARRGTSNITAIEVAA
jgi:hypothetical protein